MKLINKLTASIFVINFTTISIAHADIAKDFFNNNKTNTISIANSAEPETIDPHKMSGVPESNLLRQMFEGLASSDKNGRLVAGMATHWQTKDNKTWIFYLRNAKWSNGKPVTADDFVYSFRRLVNPATASPYASYLVDANISNAKAIMDEKLPIEQLGIKALNSKTLQITLDKPTPYLPNMLTHVITSPIYPPVVEKYGDKWTKPNKIIVNGAYTLEKWEPYDYVKLKRNPLYYNNKNTKIDTAIFLPTNDEQGELYNQNKIDLVERADFASSIAPKSEKKIAPMLCTYYYEFNMQKPPFNDIRVRKALNYVINRKVITDSIIQGQTPAYQLTPPTINTNTEQKLQLAPTWQALPMPKRIAKAKRLLKQAGYNKDNPLQFELLYNTSANHKKIALAIQNMWQNKLKNVEVKLVNKEWKSYLDSRKNGDYQVVRAGWCGDYNEPSTFLNIFKSNNSLNYSGYRSKAYDNLMEKTLAPTTSNQQRLKLYRQAERQLDKDMPVMDFYYYNNFLLIKPYVKGYPFNNPMNEWKIKDMSIDKNSK